MVVAKLSKIFTPISRETQHLLANRWAQLPEDLKTARQVVGQHWVQCGFITGPSYCSFGCSHCYLPKNANHVTQPSISEIKLQIDANRQFLGPGGHLQITGGDVVDAYLKTNRFDDLVDIIAYANHVDLVPMLMTHGQSLLDHPELLNRLVSEAGLRKISFHIDMTQHGRAGYPAKKILRESDLNSLRDAFTTLVLNTRKQTGKRLVGAQTVTVSEKNIGSIEDIIHWQTSNPKNLSAFSTLSFQPEADVGRTRFSDHPVTPDRVWQTLCQASGKSLARDALHFGHPDCSSIAMLVVDTKTNRIIDLMVPDKAFFNFWQALLKHFGGIGGRGHHGISLMIRKVSVLIKHPSLFVYGLGYLGSILAREKNLPQFFKSVFQGKVGAFKIVMHNFIDAKDLINPDEVTQARLDACSFRGAIKIQGHWQAVPMCLTNAKHR